MTPSSSFLVAKTSVFDFYNRKYLSSITSLFRNVSATFLSRTTINFSSIKMQRICCTNANDKITFLGGRQFDYKYKEIFICCTDLI